MLILTSNPYDYAQCSCLSLYSAISLTVYRQKEWDAGVHMSSNAFKKEDGYTLIEQSVEWLFY